MKLKSLLLSSFLLLSVCLNAQENGSLFNTFTASIKGQLVGYNPTDFPEFELSFSVVVPSPESQQPFKMAPEADGSFTFELPYPIRNTQVWFSADDYYYGQLVIDEGLTIEVDLEKLKKKSGQFFSSHVAYGGPDAEMNDYISRFTKFEVNNRPDPTEKRKIMMDRKMETEEKLELMEPFYLEELAMIQSYVNKHPSKYGAYVLNEKQAEHYGELFVMHWGKDMDESLLEEAMNFSPLICSNSGMLDYYGYGYLYFNMNARAQKNDLIKNRLLSQITYDGDQERLKKLITLMDKKEAGQEIDQDLYKAELKYFRTQYQDSLAVMVNEIALAAIDENSSGEKADILKMKGGGDDTWERATFIGQALPTMKNEYAKKIVVEDYERLKAKINKVAEQLANIEITDTPKPLGINMGKLDSGDELYKTNQKNVEDFLSAIRSTHKDKTIILDVWATWCGPCIGDMKKSAANVKKLREKNIVVIYLCEESGATEKLWKKKVAEFGLGTQHFFMEGTMSGKVMDFFKLTGYPSHIVIDKDGKYYPNLIHSISGIDFDDLKPLMK